MKVGAFLYVWCVSVSTDEASHQAFTASTNARMVPRSPVYLSSPGLRLTVIVLADASSSMLHAQRLFSPCHAQEFTGQDSEALGIWQLRQRRCRLHWTGASTLLLRQDGKTVQHHLQCFQLHASVWTLLHGGVLGRRECSIVAVIVLRPEFQFFICSSM
jgi:hypothetical protein